MYLGNFFEEIEFFLAENQIEYQKTESTEKTWTIYMLDTMQLMAYTLSFFVQNSTPISKQIVEEKPTICLYEDMWHTQKNIIQSRLLHLFHRSVRIPARLTQVRRIEKPLADNFLKKNHLQGFTSAKYKYGLFLPQRYFRVLNTEIIRDETASELLVAVATFGAIKKYFRADGVAKSGELIRFASLLHCSVVGGFDKLLRQHIRETAPDDMMTYVDADWSEGLMYQKRGFERIEKIPPTEFLVNRITYERIAAKKQEIQPDFIKIYNSGSWKFIRKT